MWYSLEHNLSAIVEHPVICVLCLHHAMGKIVPMQMVLSYSAKQEGIYQVVLVRIRAKLAVPKTIDSSSRAWTLYSYKLSTVVELRAINFVSECSTT